MLWIYFRIISSLGRKTLITHDQCQSQLRGLSRAEDPERIGLAMSRCRRFRDGEHLLASHGERPRDILASHAEFIRLPGRRFM